MRHGAWCGVRAAAMVAATFLCHPVRAEVVTLVPIKDNTLYEDPAGALSNGSGQHVFAGHTAINTDAIRRAMLAFDIAGHVPAGAAIDSVALTLHLSMAPFTATSQPYDLHRLLSDWGEGVSDAPFQEGGGTASTLGDATWVHTFFDDQTWITPGGDFAATASATQSVGGVVGFYTWGSTAQMRADVQLWLDDPSSNFGWILRGIETQRQTARRFDSVQNPETTFRPSLRVEFSTPSDGAGRIPDGATVPGLPLLADDSATDQITLRWGDSCQTGDFDYEVYEGALGDFASHVPVTCSTSGATTATFTPAAGNSYYLVVPRNATAEGSYGRDGTLVERLASTAACLPQSIADCP